MKKLSLVFVAALAFAAIGCKKKGGGAAGPDCGAAISHSMDLSKEDMKKVGADDKMMQKMVELGIQRCKEDKWPADAVKCMVDAQTMGSAQQCYDKLTQDQRDKMNAAAMQAMAAQGSGGGGSGGGSGGSAAPDGSAAGGSATGAGSAAAGSGSAAAGSAAAGSAAGSGSAAPK